ncbi:MAG: undecaprenyldiphospho-muramoylpentapeptide beta-N-acetylglucosaminyltransferase [Alphaproteobacteria bacterium]
MTTEVKQILISAGGTGGHMFPAEALARDLIGRGYRVALATDVRGQKYKPFADGIPIYVLKSGAMSAGIFSKIKTILALGIGYIQARRLIDKLKPAVVIGFGGYPSFPAVYAAQKKNIPTIIHEQNAILGKANAYLAPKADRIALSWNNVESIDESDAVRSVVTGNPVRPDIAALYNKPYPALNQDGPLKILVLGGSQGASIFGEILPQMVDNLSTAHKARLEITQQCIDDDIDQVREAYAKAGVKAELATFFSDVAKRLENCHLVIARSGAGTVCEVTTAGRPAIFVPYPWHKDQQQKRNADAVFDAGGAWVMTQDGFTVEALLARIETFLQNPEALFNAAENARTCGRPDAARRLGNLVTALASGWDKNANKSFDLTQGRDD